MSGFRKTTKGLNALLHFCVRESIKTSRANHAGRRQRGIYVVVDAVLSRAVNPAQKFLLARKWIMRLFPRLDVNVRRDQRYAGRITEPRGISGVPRSDKCKLGLINGVREVRP